MAEVIRLIPRLIVDKMCLLFTDQEIKQKDKEALDWPKLTEIVTKRHIFQNISFILLTK